jgi:glycosyltransferase involved in cell wall biosynthesis
MISIIICTLNEEHYLPKLLNSLWAQKNAPICEIIVIDGGSTDGTKSVVEAAQQIAPKTYSLRWANATEKGVAKQRNEGASLATYEQLLFLDADVVLNPDFLSSAMQQLQAGKIPIAGTKLYAAEPGIGFRLSYYLFSNIYLPFERIFKPVIHGCAIFATQTMHNYIGGFKSGIILEDYVYASTAAQVFRPPLLKGNAYIYTSARRFYNMPLLATWELVKASIRSFYTDGIDPKQMPTYEKNTGKHGAPRY